MTSVTVRVKYIELFFIFSPTSAATTVFLFYSTKLFVKYCAASDQTMPSVKPRSERNILLKNLNLECRRSHHLAVAVVFLAFLVDTATLSVLTPLLPRLVRAIYANDGQNVKIYEDNIGELIGLIAGIGPLVETVIHPLIGFIVNFIGDRTAFNLGSIFQIIGSILLMFSDQIWHLIVGRVAQSLGSSFACIAGFSLLASRVNDENRMTAFNVVCSGWTFGYLIGYSTGGLFYQIGGSTLPFLIILIISLLDFFLRFLIPNENGNVEIETEIESRSQIRIFLDSLRDPYVIVILTLSASICMMPAAIIATLPNFLIDDSDAKLIGIMYFIATILEAIFQMLSSHFVNSPFSRFIVILLTLISQSAALFMMFFTLTIWIYLIPLILLRVSVGLFGSLVTSLLAHVSDTRKLDNYNHLYSLFTGFCTMGFGLGPIFGGFMVGIVGFREMNLILGAMCLPCAILSLYLCKVNPKRCDIPEVTPNNSSRLIEKK